MRWNILLVLALCVHLCTCNPLIKAFCAGSPLFRGRLDPLVSPGIVSGHVHKVAGASNFGPESAAKTPIDVYNDLRASPCTTCSIGTVDLSAYWHPDLYYEWPNGTFSLVPSGGLTVYYLARTGTGDQENPDWQAFPPGFRMMSGSPYRRTYNASSVADKAISFACLSDPGGPEYPNLTLTQNNYCLDGLRLQVHFPQCWDGVNLDSANHMDHVAFPIEAPDNGNCPSTHPVRTFDIFFEAFYSVSSFPHGPPPHGDGTQRFRLSCGDSTGYGFHGDFLSGWDQTVLQNVLTDPTCDDTNTNEGNSPQNCAPLSQYIQETPDGACSLNHKVPLTENLGFVYPISALPGCNNITGFGQVAPICSSPPSATVKAPVGVRFHLKSVSTGKFWSCPALFADYPLSANITNSTGLTYYEVFSAATISGQLVSLLNEGPVDQYVSASGNNNILMCNRGSPSGWEEFQFIAQTGGNVAIISNRNNLYITANADGTLAPSSSTIGTAQLFTQVVPSGGSAF